MNEPVTTIPVYSNAYADDLVARTFALEHLRRGHVAFLTRDLPSTCTRDVLPPGSRVLAAHDDRNDTEILADVGGAIVSLYLYTNSSSVRVSAPDLDAATAVYDAIAERVPPVPDDDTVLVRFADAEDHDRRVRVATRPWPTVEALYPAAVRAAMGALLPFRPEGDDARRLMVWYGPPGTGKTTAVRALLHAWRDWARGVVVTDPERLLTHAKYLRRLVLDAADGKRWRLLVLEDAEALLRKETGGSALGKLLNLADGLLGQGVRCLYLITTNEPVGALHPALVRPGRCLARVEFPALSAAETAAVLGRPVDRGQTLAEVVAARAVATETPSVAVGQYL
jgi:hypothetical protein